MGRIQAILFDRDHWTTSSARTWLKKNDHTPIKRAHTTDNFIRYRLEEPSNFKHFITKKLDEHIELIIGFIS